MLEVVKREIRLEIFNLILHRVSEIDGLIINLPVINEVDWTVTTSGILRINRNCLALSNSEAQVRHLRIQLYLGFKYSSAINQHQEDDQCRAIIFYKW